MNDLISRQAAIDALEEPYKMSDTWTDEYAVGKRMQWEKDVKVLNSLQSAQQWIPCSERLPDMHDEVIVTARGEVSIAWRYVDGKWRSNDMPQPMFRDIIAWMPLPEPYKAESEDKE